MSVNPNCCADTTCCGTAKNCCANEADKWITGEISTQKGNIPIISTRLVFSDRFGACKARWGIGRMNYKIDEGLYAVGNPDGTSPVLVSANYKLSFDSLRRELKGLDCWILILDTKGVNVWCAAGKGTFGTEELITRINRTGLPAIVSHRTLILPQLGASGISAHEVAGQSGFSVIYGPVRAHDIKAFIASGNEATKEMRTVRFTLLDRLVLTPVELVHAAKTSLMVLGMLFLINLFAARHFGMVDFIAYAGAVLIGTVITPVLLPFIPGKAFSWKGWLLGLCWAAYMIWINEWFASGPTLLGIGYALLIPSLSAYWAMNFTGSSTYTSFSGVMKEMKIALPFLILSSVTGSVLLFIRSLITQ